MPRNFNQNNQFSTAGKFCKKDPTKKAGLFLSTFTLHELENQTISLFLSGVSFFHHARAVFSECDRGTDNYFLMVLTSTFV